MHPIFWVYINCLSKVHQPEPLIQLKNDSSQTLCSCLDVQGRSQLLRRGGLCLALHERSTATITCADRDNSCPLIEANELQIVFGQQRTTPWKGRDYYQIGKITALQEERPLSNHDIFWYGVDNLLKHFAYGNTI